MYAHVQYCKDVWINHIQSQKHRYHAKFARASYFATRICPLDTNVQEVKKLNISDHPNYIYSIFIY